MPWSTENQAGQQCKKGCRLLSVMKAGTVAEYRDEKLPLVEEECVRCLGRRKEGGATLGDVVAC